MRFLQLRSAVTAAGGVVVDLAEAVGALAGLLDGSGGGLFLLVHLGNELDEGEDAQCNQEEINNRLDESTEFEHGSSGIHGSLEAFVGVAVQRNIQGGEIDLSGSEGKQRHDQIIYHAGNDLGESTADHNADSHVEYVALEGKFLEIIPHRNHPSLCFFIIILHFVPKIYRFEVRSRIFFRECI